MPQLVSIHMSDIGPAAARFRSVRMPLTDKATGLHPVDTFIWLRNGGGKGVIKALYYSIFRPSLHEFAGKLSGERRHIRDMVKRQGVAVIATEWTVPGSQPRLDGTRATRVVGQALAWPGGQYRGDRTPERRFFSFKTDGETVTADMLPLRGRSNHATSLDVFEDWFDRVLRDRPDLEPVWFRDGQQKDWMRFLESCHFDLEGFKIQLQMNKTEGGASQEILSFTREEEFLDVVLQSLLDENGLSDLQDYLKGVREKIQRRPVLEAEVDLFAALSETLRQVEERVAARDRAEQALTDQRRAVRAIGEAAVAHRAIRREEIDAQEEAHAAAAASLEADRAAVRTNARRLNGAKLVRQERLVQDAQAREQTAESALDRARTRRMHTEAAISIAKRRDLETRVSNLEARIQARSEPKRRKHATLVAAAQAYAACLDAALNAATARRDAAREAVEAAEAERDRADDARVRADVEAHSAEREIARQEAAIQRAEEARQALRDEGLMTSGEDARRARTRHAERLETLRHRAEEAARGEDAAREQAEEKRRAHAEAETAQRDAERQRDDVRQRRARYQEAYAAVAREPLLLDLQEAETAANPYAPNLLTRIDGRIDDLEADRKRQIRRHEDAVADLEAMDRNDGLLPPSRDVERVRDHLAECGLKAFGYPEYLRQQGATSDEIAELIRRDPARYGGIAVVGQRQFERACAERTAVDNLRAPVQMTLVSAADLPALDGRAVVATHPATYRKEAALDLKAELEARRDTAAQRSDELARALDAARTTRMGLTRFLETYPEGTEEQLSAALERAEADLNARAATVRELAQACAELAQTCMQWRETWRACEEERDQVGEHVRRLDHHLAVHEDGLAEVEQALDRARHDLQGWRERGREARAAMRAAVERLQAAEDDRARADREIEETRALLHSVDGYAGGARAQAEDAAAARAAYESAKASYESETGPTELEAELRALRERLEGQRAETAALLGDLEAEGLDREQVESDVARATTMPDLQAAKRAERDADRETVRRQSEREHAERELAALEQSADLERPAGSEAWTLAACDEAIARFDAEKAAAEGRVQEHQERLAAVAETLARLRSDHQTLDAAVTNTAYILEIDSADLGPAEVSAADLGPVDGYESRLRQARDQLSAHRAEMEKAERGLQRAVNAVRAELNSSRHAGVADSLKDRMREQLDRLDRAAPTFRQECDEAVSAKRSEIASIETDEADLVRQFDVAVDDLRQKLQKLGPCSRVPDGFGAWSGRDFFLVNMTEEVRSTDARRAMIRDYIQRLVADDNARIPPSAELLKACAHAVFDGNLAIKAFKPAMGFPLGRHAMLDILQSSGGEKLTAAIMIYMTLDRLSAVYGRGQTGAPEAGRTLLLDNPIGPCNLRDFLEFQRAVAASCGIQLVILSGINDPGVVSLYPRVITVQNLHQDRKTGENVVQVVDDGSQSTVTAATLVFDQSQLDMPRLPGGDDDDTRPSAS